MRKLFAFIGVIVFFAACSDNQTKEAAVEKVKKTEPVILNTEGVTFLGESFEIGRIVAVSALEKQMKVGDSAVLVARGIVEEVCQAKGCWMTLKLPNKRTIRVTFKDYGFFMPKDIAGKEVIMKGQASYTTTDVATLQHLAADAGKTQEEIEQITMPEKALTFEAYGVTII